MHTGKSGSIYCFDCIHPLHPKGNSLFIFSFYLSQLEGKEGSVSHLTESAKQICCFLGLGWWPDWLVGCKRFPLLPMYAKIRWLGYAYDMLICKEERAFKPNQWKFLSAFTHPHKCLASCLFGTISSWEICERSKRSSSLVWSDYFASFVKFIPLRFYFSIFILKFEWKKKDRHPYLPSCMDHGELGLSPLST